jgi:hypothetical protein
MSTNAVIGMQHHDGSVKSIYLHWDGYPSHAGAVLIEHYLDANKVDMLINLGDISFLGPEVTEAPKEVIGTDLVYNFTSAYHRDKGEQLNPPRAFENEYQWMKDAMENTSAEYGYLYEAGGGWVYYDLHQPRPLSIQAELEGKNAR